MPNALQFIIGGNSQPFTAALGQVSAIAKRVSQSTITDLKAMEVGLQNQLAVAIKGTQQWHNYAAALKSVQAQISQTQAKMDLGFAPRGKSTIFAPNRTSSPHKQYAKDFGALLDERDEAARLASVEAASRARRAAELRRQRAEDRAEAARAGSVDSAARANKAAQLRRQRAEERAEAARLASVETASRANQASALRRQRAEERAEAARLASVEAASRARRAAELRRQRAEDRAEAARAGSVDSAARANKAAQLRRQRAEERAEESRLASVEAASRANKARALRRERAEERAEAARRGSMRGQLGEFFDSAVGRFTGGLAVGYGIKRGVESILQTSIAYERIRNTLKAASGSAQQAALDFEFLHGEAKRIGFDMLGVGDDFARFSIAARNANMTTAETRKIFSAVASASAVMGLSTERQHDAFLALEQMLSKNKVSMQELRLQLGNAMPSAFSTFAKALGVTTGELDKMVSSGEVLAKDALPKFADQLNKSFKLEDSTNEALRNIARMKLAIADLQAQAGKTFLPVASEVAKGLAVELGFIEKIIASNAVLLAALTTKGPWSAKQKMLVEMSQGIWGDQSDGGKYESNITAEIDAMIAAAEGVYVVNEDLQKLTERLNELNRKTWLDSLTDAEKLVALTQQRADLEAEIAANKGKTKPEDAVRDQTTLAELNAEISALERKDTNRNGRSLANFQSAGAWGQAGIATGLGAGLNQNPLLDVNKQQLTELRAINAALSKRGARKVRF